MKKISFVYLLLFLISLQAKAQWTGTWNTTFDKTLTLQQSGNQVTGKYLDVNEISGVYNPTTRKLKGTFMNGSRKGGFEFTLSADSKSFTGKWSWNTNLSGNVGNWNGNLTSKPNSLLSKDFSNTTFKQGTNFNGRYDNLKRLPNEKASKVIVTIREIRAPKIARNLQSSSTSLCLKGILTVRSVEEAKRNLWLNGLSRPNIDQTHYYTCQALFSARKVSKNYSLTFDATKSHELIVEAIQLYLSDAHFTRNDSDFPKKSTLKVAVSSLKWNSNNEQIFRITSGKSTIEFVIHFELKK